MIIKVFERVHICQLLPFDDHMEEFIFQVLSCVVLHLSFPGLLTTSLSMSSQPEPLREYLECAAGATLRREDGIVGLSLMAGRPQFHTESNMMEMKQQMWNTT